MKKNLLKIASIVLAGSMILASCKKDDDPKPAPENKEEQKTTPGEETTTGAYSNATFVVCQGNFQQNEGSIDAIINGVVTKDIFQKENGRPLGDIAQSMIKTGDKAFIVMNNSGKVEAVNVHTFKSEGICKGLSYPRYVANRNDEEIFVSNGNGLSDDDYVYVINKQTMQKTDSVPTGFGPNTMVVSNGKLFVANSGGWSTDKTITVIDTKTLAVEKTITVGDNPYDMDIDENGNIIVFCQGASTYDEAWNVIPLTNAAIYTINGSTLEASATIEFDHQLQSTGYNLIAYNNGIIYYIDNGINTFSKGETNKIIEGSFFSISIDPTTNDIWVGETPQNSLHSEKQYDKAGNLIKTYSVTNMPEAVIF